MLSFSLYWLLFLTPETSMKFVVMTLLFLGIATIPRPILYLLICSFHKYSLIICHVTPIMLDVEYTKEKKQSSCPQNTPEIQANWPFNTARQLALRQSVQSLQKQEWRNSKSEDQGPSNVKLERWMGKKEIGAANRPSRRRNSFCKKEQQRHKGTSPMERAENISEQV